MAFRYSPGLPGWESVSPKEHLLLGVLSGEGVGPEVTRATLRVVEAAAQHLNRSVEIRRGGLIGREAEAAQGRALTPEVIDWCEGVFAEGGPILCGPGGGRFVYDLRRRFDLYCKLTPVRRDAALGEVGSLRPEVARRADLIVVRENTGGLYYGSCDQSEAGVTHSYRYERSQIQRILECAVRVAAQRAGRLCLVVKPGGIPGMSDMWIRCFQNLVRSTDAETSILEIDNAAYQIVAAPEQFDVVVAPNMFGDVLSDVAALLLGSRGLSFSGNFGAPGTAVYQTGHGAAYDIAGQDRANPVAHIRAAAMLLRESFAWEDAASLIESAITRVFDAGYRTADIAEPGATVLGTADMGERIAEEVPRAARQPDEVQFQ